MSKRKKVAIKVAEAFELFVYKTVNYLFRNNFVVVYLHT